VEIFSDVFGSAAHSSSTHPLDPSHRFLFRNASVSNAIQVPPEQILLLLRS
jgi:hypothetical protein